MKYVVSSSGKSIVVPCRNVMESAGGFVFSHESADTFSEENAFFGDNNGREFQDVDVVTGDTDCGALFDERHAGENESGNLARELSGDSSIESFDIAKMSAHDIWHSILLKRHLSGGMLTRTILIAASNDSNCLPLWTNVTYQEKTVALKKIQGNDFIQHFTPLHKIAWLRMKLFNIVASNRNTYAKIRVTFNGHTSLSLATAGAPELTDDLRCRISHLALDPSSARLLGIIFGSRDSLEKTDNKTLSNPALWTELANLFVNNAIWQPYSTVIEGVSACRLIDCTVAPNAPGLDGTTVQDVFMECRTDWTRLKSRVFSATGCNSTGSAMLDDVWNHYICGGRLKFQRNIVTMYVFTTWHAAGKSLPELCNRQLAPGQQLRVGVDEQNADAFKTPEKKISESSTTGVSSSTKGKGNRNNATMQQPLMQIADAMQVLISKSVSTLGSPSESDSNKKHDGTKRSNCVVEPDHDLASFLVKNNIMKWWPDIYEKLGITNISELRFIGKDICEKYLIGLPALPVLKLAILADSKDPNSP
jgi:hypothetical protein